MQYETGSTADGTTMVHLLNRGDIALTKSHTQQNLSILLHKIAMEGSHHSFLHSNDKTKKVEID